MAWADASGVILVCKVGSVSGDVVDVSVCSHGSCTGMLCLCILVFKRCRVHEMNARTRIDEADTGSAHGASKSCPWDFVSGC